MPNGTYGGVRGRRKSSLLDLYKIKYTRSGRNGVPKGSNKRKNQLF